MHIRLAVDAFAVRGIWRVVLTEQCCPGPPCTAGRPCRPRMHASESGVSSEYGVSAWFSFGCVGSSYSPVAAVAWRSTNQIVLLKAQRASFPGPGSTITSGSAASQALTPSAMQQAVPMVGRRNGRAVSKVVVLVQVLFNAHSLDAARTHQGMDPGDVLERVRSANEHAGLPCR